MSTRCIHTTSAHFLFLFFRIYWSKPPHNKKKVDRYARRTALTPFKFNLLEKCAMQKHSLHHVQNKKKIWKHVVRLFYQKRLVAGTQKEAKKRSLFLFFSFSFFLEHSTQTKKPPWTKKGGRKKKKVQDRKKKKLQGKQKKKNSQRKHFTKQRRRNKRKPFKTTTESAKKKKGERS